MGAAVSRPGGRPSPAARQGRRLETALSGHPGVRDVATAVDDRGLAPCLIAYVVADPLNPPSVNDLRDVLRSTGAGALPVDFVRLPILLRDGEGELRHGDLLRPLEHAGPPRGPRDAVELQVAVAFEQVLGEPIGARRNFFDGGGNSFRAARAVAAVRAALGVDVPLRTIFEHPTIEEFAASVQSDGQQRRQARLLRLQPGDGPPLVLVPDLRGDVGYAYHLLRHLPAGLPILGLVWDDSSTVDEVSAAFDTAVRTAAPHGPYRIFGHGAAGAVAVELARRMRTGGDDVSVAIIGAAPVRPGTDDGEALARDVLARDAVEEFAGSARRGLFREIQADSLLAYLGAPDAARVLHALLGADPRPPLADFRDLGIETQLEHVVSSWGGPGAESASRLRRLRDCVSTVTRALTDHAPRLYPGRLTVFGSKDLDGWVDRVEDVDVAALPAGSESDPALLAAALTGWLGRSGASGPGLSPDWNQERMVPDDHG